MQEEVPFKVILTEIGLGWRRQVLEEGERRGREEVCDCEGGGHGAISNSASTIPLFVSKW